MQLHNHLIICHSIQFTVYQPVEHHHVSAPVYSAPAPQYHAPQYQAPQYHAPQYSGKKKYKKIYW